MTPDDPAKPLTELFRSGTTLMVGTGSERDSLQFRPLTVARVEGDRVEILMDTSAPWTQSLQDGDVAHVTMSDSRSNTWVSLRGILSMTTDPAVIDELWNPFADAYFDDGRETPGITVLRIDGETGNYWTTPSGRLGSLISMVKAKFGDPEQAGEHGDVAL
jgi:general stress protein 26